MHARDRRYRCLLPLGDEFVVLGEDRAKEGVGNPTARPSECPERFR